MRLTHPTAHGHAAASAPAAAEQQPEAKEGAAPLPAPTQGLRLSMPASYALLGLMIALSAALANGSLAFVSQPVKVRRWRAPPQCALRTPHARLPQRGAAPAFCAARFPGARVSFACQALTCR